MESEDEKMEFQKRKSNDQHSFQLWNKKYITMIEWKRNIVDGIASKYDKISYREKYERKKKRIVFIKGAKCVLQLQSTFAACQILILNYKSDSSWIFTSDTKQILKYEGINQAISITFAGISREVLLKRIV